MISKVAASELEVVQTFNIKASKIKYYLRSLKRVEGIKRLSKFNLNQIFGKMCFIK